jgi:hypothetical protein
MRQMNSEMVFKHLINKCDNYPSKMVAKMKKIYDYNYNNDMNKKTIRHILYGTLETLIITTDPTPSCNEC